MSSFSYRVRLLLSRRNSFVFNNFVVLSFLNASCLFPPEEVVSGKYGSLEVTRHALVEQTRLIEYGGQQLAGAKENERIFLNEEVCLLGIVKIAEKLL